jgi:hypothetical protein
MDGPMGRHTVEYRAEKIPGHIDLLFMVKVVCDTWSVRIVGPGFF